MSYEPFDAKRYAIRVMQSKGYFSKRLPDGTYTDTDPDVMAIYKLQAPSWTALIEKHCVGSDPQNAEALMTSFGHREVKGGPGKVLETFAAHLDAQPRQGGSPDWSKAGQEWRECAYCDGRGVVSDIPVKVERRGEVIDRTYSFACVCDNGRRFAGVKVAEDWMIRFAADRKSAEIKRHESTLKRFGIDPNADPATRAKQFGRAIKSMKSQVGQNGQTARTVQPALPKTAEEARKILSGRKSVHPPEQLNPERVALAVYANGDERNEWE